MNEKATEMLANYKDMLASALDCSSMDIRLFRETLINQYNSDKERWEYVEVGELYYYKPDDEDYAGEQTRLSWDEGKYRVMLIEGDEEALISSFELYKMPHCCAIIVSCRSYVSETFRGKGVATILNKMRQDIGKHLGYSCMMCTDIEQNTAQRKVLQKNGWTDIWNVINKRTKNKVFITVVNL